MSQKLINFDTAGVGSLLPEVTEAINKFLELWDLGDPYEKWVEIYEECKKAFSKLISVDIEDISGVPNVSTATGIIAESLPFGPGSNIVVSSLEFPSNVYSWLRARSKGASVRVVEAKGGTIQLADLERNIDENTTIVAISNLFFSTGYRYDLEELAETVHKLGALLFVDAYQSVGAVDLKVGDSGVDFLSTGSSKWLMGPPGSGFLYAKKSISKNLRPAIPGWFGSEKPDDYSFREYVEARGAAKFETGTPNFIGYAGLLASIRKIQDHGMKHVESRIANLTQWVIEEIGSMGLDVITPKERRRRGGIVVFKPHMRAENVVGKMRGRRLLVAERDGGVRISVHFTNKEEEILHLISTLKELKRAGEI